MHGKLTFAALGASLCLNAVLIIYCANLSFMSPLAHDRQAEIAALKAQDQMLQSQKSALEKTTKGLQEQKEQLLKHYSETEHVGKKLEKYKEKLRADVSVVCRFHVHSTASTSDLARALIAGRGGEGCGGGCGALDATLGNRAGQHPFLLCDVRDWICFSMRCAVLGSSFLRDVLFGERLGRHQRSSFAVQCSQ